MSEFFLGQMPRLFAHRGASGEAPENTLVAFQRAADAGAIYAELDVHVTHDGQVVVLHDATLERTTNGSGLVAEKTLDELRRFDAGYRFTPDDGQTFPFRDRGVTIPTLAEVLERFPQVRFTIEIKQTEPSIEELVVNTVRACDRTGTVILASEHDRVLARVRALAPEMATSFAAGEVFDFIQRVLTGQLARYRPPGRALQVPPEFQGVQLVTPETIRAAREFGCEIHVWTINDLLEMHRLLDLDVDGLMSDFPGRLLAVVRQRQS